HRTGRGRHRSRCQPQPRANRGPGGQGPAHPVTPRSHSAPPYSPETTYTFRRTMMTDELVMNWTLGTPALLSIAVGAILPTLTGGFGGTLASVALLVGLGAMLGRMLETSGGAEVLTNALINKFGEKRAPLALSIASLLFGFPIFFDAGDRKASC